MDFSIKAYGQSHELGAAKTGCMVVAVLKMGHYRRFAQELDNHGDIRAAMQSGDISGKPGSTLLLRRAKSPAQRILLAGLGKADATTEKDFSAAVKAVVTALANIGAKDALIALPLNGIKERDAAWAVRQIVGATATTATAVTH